MYTVILKPGAEEDIDGIFKWYEEQKGGFGL